MTIALTTPSLSLDELGREWFRREPRYAGAAIVFAILCLPAFVAMQLDDRIYQDINIWIKPMKFAVSITVFMATLAWFAGWMKAEIRMNRWYVAFSWLAISAATLELLWIYGAAANGIGSHYNTGTPLMGALYTMAGIMVMILMMAAPVTAWGIQKNHRLTLSAPFRMSVVWSLYLTFALTVFTASYLASQPNHFVAGNLSDAEGSLFFGWAKDGGDLRVAHFFSLHAMHFIPVMGLAALYLSPEGRARAAVAAGAVIYSAFTLYTLYEAIAGQPFLGGAL